MTLLLTLSNVDHLENGEPTQLRLDRHGAVIGRSPQSDWSLPDPKSYVSSTHCEIDYRDGGYVLIDKSTNGTFVNGGAQRLAGPHPLKDGDVISIGHYRVGVSGTGSGAAAADSAAPAAPPASADGGWGGWSGGATPTAPAALSPGWEAAPSPPEPAPAAAPVAALWSDAAPASDGWAPAASAAAPGWGAPDAKAAPAWTPPEAPAPAPGWGAGEPAAASGWGAVEPPPPAAAPGWDAAPSAASAATTAAGWDAAPASQAWREAPIAPAAGASSVWGAAGAGPAKPAASGWDALAPAREAQASEPRSKGAVASPVSGMGALAGAWAAPRLQSPPPPAPSAPAADVWGAMAASNAVDWSRGGFGEAVAPAPAGTPAPAPSAPDPDGGAWAAFLQAAGVPAEALKVASPQSAATAGAVVKRLVAGLVVMMEARARAKAQLGAQSTTLELKGNNPLKFARSPERVLAQLLNPPERGFMGAADAVEDSFRDLQAHQMATLAAMQGALRATLDRFSPAAIRRRAEMRGVLARILPGARNATLWEAYEREFEGVAKGSDEAFMDVFAKAFKAAYEEAAVQMKSQGG